MKKILLLIIALIILILFVMNIKNNETKESTFQVNIDHQTESKVTDTPKNQAMKEYKVTFIELGSVGCRPCDMMQPIMDEIEKEYEGQVAVRFYDVNSLFGKPYAQKYGIRMIPTQVFLDKDGKEYHRHVGFFPKEELVKIIEDGLNR